MQVNINFRSGRLGVVSSEIQEWIKRRSWICIQKRLPQPRLAGFADGQILPLIPGITKTRFPVPSLEIIAKFPHLTTQPNVEKEIPVGELFMSGTGVVNAAEPNSGSHRETGAVRKEIWNSRIRDCERIKRIRDWHTDIEGTKAEWVGNKGHRCKGRIEK